MNPAYCDLYYKGVPYKFSLGDREGDDFTLSVSNLSDEYEAFFVSTNLTNLLDQDINFKIFEDTDELIEMIEYNIKEKLGTISIGKGSCTVVLSIQFGNKKKQVSIVLKKIALSVEEMQSILKKREKELSEKTVMLKSSEDLVELLKTQLEKVKLENIGLGEQVEIKNREVRTLQEEIEDLKLEKLKLICMNHKVNNQMLFEIENKNKELKKLRDAVDAKKYVPEELCSFNYCEFINDSEFKLVMKWLDLAEMKLNLLYKGSVDGFKPKLFHTKCDGLKKTLVVITSVCGFRFGGFTPCKWSSPDEYESVKDETQTSFVFSFTKREKYPLIKDKVAIQNHQQYGPIFGDKDFHIKLNTTNSYESFSFFPRCYEGNSTKPSMLASNSSFKIQDLEIFQVIS